MNLSEFEVVWPLHRWHYLSVPDADMPVDPPPLPSTWADPDRLAVPDHPVTPAALGRDTSNVAFESRTMTPRSPRSQKRRSGRHVDAGHRSSDVTAQQGRTLAIHAFLHGTHCGDRRAGELLGVCRRTVGRDRDRLPVTTPPALERAQALIDASTDRGSSAEERTAAGAWLTAIAGSSPLPMDVSRSAQGAVNAKNGVGDAVLPSSLEVNSMPASLTLDQMDACGRLYRRIRIRTDAIRRLLEPEAAHDDLTEIILDLLGEIRAATETLETLLRSPRS